MRRDWLLYLVIFSLALNLGTIGTLIYLRWQDQEMKSPSPQEAPVPFRTMMRQLNLDQQQRQTLLGLVPEHRRQVRELRQELMQQRRELFDLLKREPLPEWPPVQNKIQEIGGLQTRLEEVKVKHLLEVQKNLQPEQRRLLMTNLERKLSHLWRENSRRRGPNRLRHGPPGPSGGPPCPSEPRGSGQGPR
ncbi:MAG: Spy/CpxP family protein refolding chaperone [Thermodesulfobacteriota bacterium]